MTRTPKLLVPRSGAKWGTPPKAGSHIKSPGMAGAPSELHLCLSPYFSSTILMDLVYAGVTKQGFEILTLQLVHRIGAGQGGLAVIGIGVIIAVMFARASAQRTSSSASSNINGKGDLREWENADFLKGMELYETP